MRPVLSLIRMEKSDDGTLGVLRINGEVFCATLEPPPADNAPGESNIPASNYPCVRYSSDKYPDTFEVTNVQGRTSILFHAGNTAEDTSGCILVGQYWGKLRGERAVLNSGNTFKEFMRRMDGHDTLLLTIKEDY